MNYLLFLCSFVFCYVGFVSSTSQEVKDYFLKAHNDLRREVSAGKTSGEPPAADMTEMVWDETLAEQAERWAGNCVAGHDTYDDRKTPRFEIIGQNMYAGPDYKTATQAWFDEYKDYDFNSKGCSGVCGHYTQVAWSKSFALGCAAVDCKTKSGGSFPYGWLFICNYGPGGNWNNGAPYESGDACSKCPSGSSCSNGLCALTPQGQDDLLENAFPMDYDY